MKIACKTYGCKVNQYNSFLLIDNLGNLGFEICQSYTHADVILVNACVVTEKAEKECLQFIRSWVDIGKRIILIGCKPDFLLRSEQYSSIPFFDDLDSCFLFLKNEYFPLQDIPFKPILSHIRGRTRATVKIQNGCSQYCSYCIVPFRRGRIYSRSVEEICTEIKTLSANGYKEIVLTGTQIGLYHDFKNRSLVDLLEQIDLSFSASLARLRLSSISPVFVDNRLVNWFRTSPLACDHLHLSLQSGSNRILQLMNRLYTREKYHYICSQFKKNNPDFCISTDVIVGFPGETEDDFMETMDLVNQVQFSKVHVFPYSRRPGTVGNQLPNQLSPSTIKKRTGQMLDLSKSIRYTIKRSYIGKEIEVMIEGSKGGFTRNYLKVFVRSRDYLQPGDLIRVIPTKCNDEQLIE